MKFSVLIPAYNEKNYLERCVESVRKTGYKDLEIIVCDDSSQDNTAILAFEMQTKGVIDKFIGHLENKGRAGAMNDMLHVAEGDIILKLDADMEIVSRNIFEILERIYSDKKIGGVAIFGHTHKIKSEQDNYALGEYLVYELVNEVKKKMLPISNLAELKYPLDIHCARRKLIQSFPTNIVHDDGYMALEVLSKEYKIVHAEGVIINHLKPPMNKEQLLRVRTRGREGWKQLEELYDLNFKGYEQTLISKFINNINKYNKKEIKAIIMWLITFMRSKL